MELAVPLTPKPGDETQPSSRARNGLLVTDRQGTQGEAAPGKHTAAEVARGSGSRRSARSRIAASWRAGSQAEVSSRRKNSGQTFDVGLWGLIPGCRGQLFGQFVRILMGTTASLFMMSCGFGCSNVTFAFMSCLLRTWYTHIHLHRFPWHWGPAGRQFTDEKTEAQALTQSLKACF